MLIHELGERKASLLSALYLEGITGSCEMIKFVIVENPSRHCIFMFVSKPRTAFVTYRQVFGKDLPGCTHSFVAES